MILQLLYKQVILQDSDLYAEYGGCSKSGLHTGFISGGGGGDRICLQSRISDINLARLTIGGPELASVDFKEYSCNG